MSLSSADESNSDDECVSEVNIDVGGGVPGCGGVVDAWLSFKSDGDHMDGSRPLVLRWDVELGLYKAR